MKCSTIALFIIASKFVTAVDNEESILSQVKRLFDQDAGSFNKLLRRLNDAEAEWIEARDKSFEPPYGKREPPQNQGSDEAGIRFAQKIKQEYYSDGDAQNEQPSGGLGSIWESITSFFSKRDSAEDYGYSEQNDIIGGDFVYDGFEDGLNDLSGSLESQEDYINVIAGESGYLGAFVEGGVHDKRQNPEQNQIDESDNSLYHQLKNDFTHAFAQGRVHDRRGDQEAFAEEFYDTPGSSVNSDSTEADLYAHSDAYLVGGDQDGFADSFVDSNGHNEHYADQHEFADAFTDGTAQKGEVGDYVENFADGSASKELAKHIAALMKRSVDGVESHYEYANNFEEGSASKEFAKHVDALMRRSIEEDNSSYADNFEEGTASKELAKHVDALMKRSLQDNSAGYAENFAEGSASEKLAKHVDALLERSTEDHESSSSYADNFVEGSASKELVKNVDNLFRRFFNEDTGGYADKFIEGSATKELAKHIDALLKRSTEEESGGYADNFVEGSASKEFAKHFDNLMQRSVNEDSEKYSDKFAEGSASRELAKHVDALFKGDNALSNENFLSADYIDDSSVLKELVLSVVKLWRRGDISTTGDRAGSQGPAIVREKIYQQQNIKRDLEDTQKYVKKFQDLRNNDKEWSNAKRDNGQSGGSGTAGIQFFNKVYDAAYGTKDETNQVVKNWVNDKRDSISDKLKNFWANLKREYDEIECRGEDCLAAAPDAAKEKHRRHNHKRSQFYNKIEKLNAAVGGGRAEEDFDPYRRRRRGLISSQPFENNSASSLPILVGTLERKAMSRNTMKFLRRRSTSGTDSSETSNAIADYYSITVQIGTPPQPVEMLLDMGSGDTWIYAAPGERSNVQFNSQLSETWRPSEAHFRIRYISGEATGIWGTDVLAIAGASMESQNIALVNDGQPLDGVPGILGVGVSGQEPNVPLNLVTQGYIKSATISIYLNYIESATGQIIFGGIDRGKFKDPLIILDSTSQAQFTLDTEVSLDGNSIGSLDILVDPGTSFGLLPGSCISEISHYWNLDYDSNEGYWYTKNIGDIENKLIEFAFSGARYSLKPRQLLAASSRYFNGQFPEDRYILGFMKSDNQPVFGDVFLRNFYIFYDLKNTRVGIAEATYGNESNIEPVLSSSIPGAVLGQASLPAK